MRADATKTHGAVTSREIAAAAREYRNCPDRREEILLRLHAAGGGPAVEALGRAAGVDPEALLRWLEERYRQRRRWRRRRVPICMGPPPGPGEVDPDEAAEVAAEAAGGGRLHGRVLRQQVWRGVRGCER